MRKRALALLLLFILLFPLTASFRAIPASAWGVNDRLNDAVVLYIGSPIAYVNNAVMPIDRHYPSTAPFIQKDRTLAPVRFIAESVGAQVAYFPETRSVRIVLEDRVLSIVLGQKTLTVNGQTRSLDVPAASINGRTFLPLRAVVEALGKQVLYHRKVIIISAQGGLINPSTEDYLFDQLVDRFAAPEPVAKVHLKFEPEHVIIHPNLPILYATDKARKRLYSVNYSTGKASYITLDLAPERMAFANGELYVTLIKGERSHYWWTKDQKGAIGIYDHLTLKAKERLEMNLDPFDLAVDPAGYIYVSSGSGQWTELRSYERATKKWISTATIHELARIFLSPDGRKLYTVWTFMSMHPVVEYNLTKGKFHEQGHSGGNKVGALLRGDNPTMSPDGRFLIGDWGEVFDTGEMALTGALDRFYSLTGGGNRLYTVFRSRPVVDAYAYDSMEKTATASLPFSCRWVFYRNNQLIALSGYGQLASVKVTDFKPVSASEANPLGEIRK